MPKKLKVLLVDDSIIIIQRVKQLLKELDCVAEVLQATNGEEALVVVKENLPHIILLDINLPNKNGIEVLKEIKVTYNSSIVIIIFTVNDSEHYKKTCLEHGADEFINKATQFELIPDLIKYYSDKG